MRLIAEHPYNILFTFIIQNAVIKTLQKRYNTSIKNMQVILIK
jgi:hypothetical protein